MWVPSKIAAVTVVLVPSISGLSVTRRAMRSWLRWMAPASALSMSLPGGSSSWRSTSTVALLATSPRADPPTPSATTSRCGPAYPESWLSRRTRPTSESAA